MKIGVVGCGALGSYYGARLAQAGEDVHFLARSDFDVLRRDGLHIRSIAGDFHVRPRCVRTPAELGPCDLLLVALKTTANAAFPQLLPPLLGPTTAVATLQNGLGNEPALAAVCGAERVLGGLCFVCLNRVAPGQIVHSDHGRIILGEFERPAQPRTQEFAERFRRAHVPCTVTDDLARAHWEKLIWNVPFNGLGVAGTVGYEALVAGRVPDIPPRTHCLATDELLGTARWEQLVRELMLEVIAVARQLGHAIPTPLAHQMIERTRTMGAYKASTLIDFERHQPLELEHLFLAPQREARRLGVPVPRLDALCAVLAQLDPARGPHPPGAPPALPSPPVPRSLTA